MNYSPQDIELYESAVLGYLLDSPEIIPDSLKRLIEFAPQSFSDARRGIVGSAIKELLANGVPADFGGIRKLVAGNVDDSFLTDLMKSVPSGADSPGAPELAESNAQILLNAFTDRARKLAVGECMNQLEERPELSQAIVANLVRTVQHLDGTKFGRDASLAKLKARQFDADKVPAPLRVVYSLAGVPIATPGNLAVIAAQAKTGKTAFIGGIIAATMNPTLLAPECLGVTSAPTNGKAVVHFDSEQAPDDHWWLVDRSKKRANVSTVPNWLRTYCLTGLSAVECRSLIKLELEEAFQAFGGIHSVLLDGGADFVTDVNSAIECNEFTAELHGLAIKYDCPILVVIHFNPNGEKTRGHLGSQLERKAETNLVLRKTGEVTEVFSMKQRRAPILEGQGPKFAWSNEHGMHVIYQGKPGLSAQARYLQPYIPEVFRTVESLTYSALKSTLMRVTDKSEKTAERYIATALNSGFLIKGPGGIYTKGACE